MLMALHQDGNSLVSMREWQSHHTGSYEGSDSYSATRQYLSESSCELFMDCTYISLKMAYYAPTTHDFFCDENNTECLR